MKAAVVSWKLRQIKTDGEFFGHFHDLITLAHDHEADLAVFPENQTFELLGIDPSLAEKDIPLFLHQYAVQIEEWLARISRSSGIVLVGGSYLKITDDGPRNICPIAYPTGELTLIEKNRLTTYERSVLRLGVGRGLKKSQDPKLGATICYDIEFPEAARALAESGAMAIAVPAFTENEHGFHRVRNCAAARAIENQVYVLHASLIGSLGKEPAPSAVGNSAILSPIHQPFPAEGVLAQTPWNQESLVVAELDFDLLEEVRSQGDVRNWRDREPLFWEVIE